MFRTELTIAPQERLLPRTARVLTVGSCFADSMGERLRLNKVNALVNPFGTVFQPLALAQLLRAAAGEAQDWQQHVVEARGRWQSYDFHSTIGAESPVELLQTIQETVRRVGDFVRTADAVVLTLGTAWAYRLRETGELVSNLHKLPASLFEKELLTADEIVNGLAEVHALLRRMNPDLKIVLTVSPVRHIKDTLPLNAVSKSVLRVACHYLSELLPNVSYFPAYELLTDDLRDYRFYAADMLHPSEVAEDYIWERFARAYFDADFGRFRKEWAAVRQALGHRPLHIGAPEHRTFLDQTRERLERLTSQSVDVRQELRDVQRQLVALPPPKPVRVAKPEPEDDGEERIDIGEGGESAPVASHSRPADAAVVTTERRRDERRDNPRDGRRPDRTSRDRRTGRPVPAAAPLAAEAVPIEAPVELLAQEPAVEEPGAAVVETLLTSPESELPTTDDATGYPAKKKKRRSRGGAKRTARKHAARLAAEQPGAAGEHRAEAELVEEQALETADLDVAVTAPEAAAVPAASAAAAEAPVVAAEPDAVPLPEAADADDLPETTAGQPTRKRGTGPTPKKSTVITKSPPVKRGQRAGLYRAPTAEAATPAGAPAAAPIISPPIIPEILLERPAADFATFAAPVSARQTEEMDLAASVLGLYSTKATGAAEAAPPRRGRPKAAAKAPVAEPVTAAAAAVPAVALAAGPVAPEPVATEPAVPEPAATEPVVPEAVATEPVAPEPAATEPTQPVAEAAATPAPKAATRKPAARAAKAAQPATPKKATAKPAAKAAKPAAKAAKPAAKAAKPAAKPTAKAAAKPAAKAAAGKSRPPVRKTPPPAPETPAD